MRQSKIQALPYLFFVMLNCGLRAEAVGAFFGGGKAAEKKVRNAVTREQPRLFQHLAHVALVGVLLFNLSNFVAFARP